MNNLPPVPNMAVQDAEKAKALEIEIISNSPVSKEGDYSGAVAKTDQKEIDLVKKLDWRILPILWAMYFL